VTVWSPFVFTAGVRGPCGHGAYVWRPACGSPPAFPVFLEVNLPGTTVPDDVVLLVSQDHKQFVFALRPGATLQSHRGIVAHDDLIGQRWGQRVRSHLGHRFTLLRPSTDDLVRHLKRSSQIVYPKDAGYILMKLGIRAGCRVIEAGTGSGGMALVLSQAVKPTGRVYSYDSRPDMQRLAHENLTKVGLDHFAEFKLRDVADGFDETGVDALFYDLPNPWDYLKQAAAALSNSGFFGCILPTTNQVADLLHALIKSPFTMVEVEELILRPYKPVPARLRPNDRIIGHTGFLVFARKLAPDDATESSGAESFSSTITNGSQE
jgi:tRNA (adenine57-N1/adenine58-N1)-methyltransferase